MDVHGHVHVRLYTVNARPDTVRVTATAVAGEKGTRLQAELAVPQSQPQ